MSFLDDLKIFGIVTMLIGVISLITAVVAHKDDLVLMVAWALLPLAILLIGFTAYNGELKKKFDVVYTFLIFCGLALVISYAIIFIAGGLDGNWVLKHLLFIGVGLFAFIIGVDMRTGVKMSMLIWILLALVFLVFLVVSILSILDGSTANLEGIAQLATQVLFMVMSVYMLYFTLTTEVRNKFH